MLQVVTPEKMRLIEERAIQSGISREMLMEQAGLSCAKKIAAIAKQNQHIIVLCGKGNNGGDGYATARELLKQGFQIACWQIPSEKTSTLLKLQRERFEKAGGKVTLFHGQDIPRECLIVDAIFGIGFGGSVEGVFYDAISKINQSKAFVVSIDIPSGLHGETGEISPICVQANRLLAIEFLKIGYFIHDGWNVCGLIDALSIGLKSFSDDSEIECVTLEDLPSRLPLILRNRHKYQAGHVVGIAGSKGMMGAACLAGLASLKSGCGICHLLHPESASLDAIKSPLEVITISYPDNKPDAILKWLQSASACFIGPGIGTSDGADRLMRFIWDHLNIKCVLDADALNWISKHFKQQKIGLLSHCILTPHQQEMRRLLQSESKGPITASFLQECQVFTEQNSTHLVLKGGPTFLFSHKRKMIIMPFGDPGMATAGSGDVLTGMLASLMAQGLSPELAMILGTSLHGLAGLIAARQETPYCLTATSLIHYLPQAFQALR